MSDNQDEVVVSSTAAPSAQAGTLFEKQPSALGLQPSALSSRVVALARGKLIIMITMIIKLSVISRLDYHD